MKSSLRRRIQDRSKGSMILEILLAFAVFSILCLPVLLFIFSTEEYQNKIARSQSLAYEEKVANETQWFKLDNINGYSNRHSCDMALIEYAAAMASGTMRMPTVVFPNFFYHPRNIPAVMQYIPYDGREYIVMGTNSASTSDPDMYVMRKDSTGAFSVVGYVRSFGPGIADFDFFNALIFIAQRSMVNQIMKMPIDRLLDGGIGYATSSDSGSTTETMRQFADVSASSLIPIIIPSSGLALRILSSKDWLFVGMDKNLGKEISAYKVVHREGRKQLNETYSPTMNAIETDAGINDLVRTPYELIAASPNPVEFGAYLLKMPAYLNGSTTATSSRTGDIPFRSNGDFYGTKNFDAPGSSGNGKAIAAYKKDAYFGRTVGNVELYASNGLLDDGLAAKSLLWRFGTTASFDLNKTILHIEEIFGGSFLLLLAKTPSPAIEIMARNPNGSYALKGEIPLPVSPTGMTCAGKDIVVGMESTTTPIAVIRL